MRVDLLGGLRVDDNVAVRPRSRTVLAALAVHRDRAVTADELADAVWGDGPLPRSWAKQVQYCIWDLRKVLGAEAIETVDGGYRLRAESDALDVSDFEALVEQGRHFAATGEADRAASTFTRALGLWRGAPFQDLDGWMPGRHEAARLDELRRSAEEDLVEARLAAGDHRDVVALAERRAA
jgi:DNA-binding SARP family transcriptional activator